MKIFKLLVVAVFAFGLNHFALAAPKSTKEAGITFETLDGKVLKPSDYKGKWVIVNYWAGWCHSCFEEVPDLNAFQKSHSNVIILGVNFDHATASQQRVFIRQMGMNFPSLKHDPINQLNIAPIEGLPTSIIISPEGKPMRAFVGKLDVDTLNQVIGNKEQA
jgi:thiol-disulfide isomerase/thioredoxin